MRQRSLLSSKLWYTFFIILVYLLGRDLPLYGIDLSAYGQFEADAESLLMQTISGDSRQCSLFVLGISPYMIASIVGYLMMAFRSSEMKKKISPMKMNRWILRITILIAVVMAAIQVQSLQFREMREAMWMVKTVAAIEMVAGTSLILYLMSRNQKYGIGGQTMLIFLNISTTISSILQGRNWSEICIPLLISFVMIIAMLIMENTELRVPVQRISIHNIYADKNYLAVKLNPIGVMPMMFSTSVFMLVQLLAALPAMLLPESGYALWLQENMNLSSPIGIGIYVLILYGLTVGSAWIMINPKEFTEQLLKSGDSIQDLHAGEETKRYLSRVVLTLSLFSATILSICLCVPIILQAMGILQDPLSNLPSTAIMLTGIWCNLSREVLAIRDLEAYKPFV